MGNSAEKLAKEDDSARLPDGFPDGYDEEFVNPVDDDLQCPICHLALREPILTKCGHRFCRGCLERHMARQESQQQVYNCPIDREELVHLKDVFPDKATGRKILSLIIKCPSAGCEWTGELRQKKDHLLTCSFKLVSCTNANCEVMVRRKDLEEHVTTSCEWRIVACDHCSEPHKKCLLQDHVDNCKKKPVECPNSCGEIIVQEKITSHIDNECPLTVVPCPYAQMGCSAKIQRKEFESHLQSTMALHLALTCTTFKETTEKLEQKVNALQKQVQELSAANSTIGAKVDAQKREFASANYTLGAKVDAQKREFASANYTLGAKVDAQKREFASANYTLDAKVYAQKREFASANSALDAKVDAQKREFASANSAVDAQKIEFACATSALDAKVDAQKREFASANSALDAKVDAQKREFASANSALSTKVDAQNITILRLTNESFPFVWKITGFSDILRQAKNGSATRIHSDPFYTGKQGYKLMARIEPDGDQTNKNSYLSASVGIMKGSYDAILPWPFCQKVTFTVIDQQYEPANRKNVEEFFTTEQITWRFSGRPTTKQNAEFYGIRRLVSHKILNTRRYVVDDTLFLQVDIGPHDNVCRSYSDSDS